MAVPAWKLKKMQEEEERKRLAAEEQEKKKLKQQGVEVESKPNQPQSEQIDQETAYKAIINTIRQHGAPNPSFPKDLDIEFGEYKRSSRVVHEEDLD
eukprot:TRINITY_DN3273_c0_g2_i1.p1 TRINITY_DN3273_c0_g2~~TRINITY_DN3273_c0_g2_i1.p1  ORF type:complete len:110 (-),score=37.31 TRINITY_DN3273_c0_g2_i1:27-317(-)